MTDRDAELWWQAQRVVGRKTQNRETSPCDDCCREFAEDMRAVGRCNGLYPGEDALDRYRLAARRETWCQSSRKRRAAMVL